MYCVNRSRAPLDNAWAMRLDRTTSTPWWLIPLQPPPPLLLQPLLLQPPPLPPLPLLLQPPPPLQPLPPLLLQPPPPSPQRQPSLPRAQCSERTPRFNGERYYGTAILGGRGITAAAAFVPPGLAAHAPAPDWRLMRCPAVRRCLPSCLS